MKRRRRQRQRMLVLLGAVVLLAVVLIVIISSCSKKNQGAGITAQAFSTGSELTLPVNADLNSGDYVSYGGYQFDDRNKALPRWQSFITKNKRTSRPQATITPTARPISSRATQAQVWKAGVCTRRIRRTSPSGTSSWATTARSSWRMERWIFSCRST